jgi:hypothetical protein
MRVWLLTIGEPVPLGAGVRDRLHRTGSFARYLVSRGHQVVWWTSAFDHFRKQHLAGHDTVVTEPDGLRIRMLRGSGYKRNVSLERFRDHRQVAQRFRLLSQSEEEPDILVSALPTLEMCLAKRSQLKRRAEIAINERLPFRSRWYFREPDEAPNATIDRRILSFRVVRPTFLEGYWQDERYFSDIAAELKQELTFSTRHTAANEELAAQMRSGESVAVHMRLLQPNPPAGVDKPLDTIATLCVEYYRAAIAAIRERVPGAKLYLFSDSPANAVLPIGEDDAVRVVNEGEDAQYEDLWLMSQCRHFVLANSTFSWWGAWMGERPTR